MAVVESEAVEPVAEIEPEGVGRTGQSICFCSTFTSGSNFTKSYLQQQQYDALLNLIDPNERAKLYES